jgi:charged multivesicular body protein 7
LYSDFETLKTINPDGYNANLATWQNALARALNAGVILGNEDRLILHNGAYLRETLRTKEYGTPSAINFLIVRTEAVSI